MSVETKGLVFRVTGLPALRTDAELRDGLLAAIDDNMEQHEQSRIVRKTSIVPSCQNKEEKVALIEFIGGVPLFLSKLETDPMASWQIEMGDAEISFDRHFLGLTQLYTPEPETKVTADIIAVTGLDGHAYGSWRGKGNFGRMWLRDFLSQDMPRCRTMIYGYNAKLSAHAIDTIMDYGRGLLVELTKSRNTAEVSALESTDTEKLLMSHTEITQLRERPIFFIAHSFGGIVLAHCLLKAAQAEGHDSAEKKSLLIATYAMLLFGVPHKGLVVHDLQRLLTSENNDARLALLVQIRRNSDFLAYQLQEFKKHIRGRKIVSFYETGQTRQLVFDAQTKRWRRTGDFFTAVDIDSALLQLPDCMEDKIPVEASHTMMVKFDTRSDRGYTTAREKLRLFEQNAPAVIAARFLSMIVLGSVASMDGLQKPEDDLQESESSFRELPLLLRLMWWPHRATLFPPSSQLISIKEFKEREKAMLRLLNIRKKLERGQTSLSEEDYKGLRFVADLLGPQYSIDGTSVYDLIKEYIYREEEFSTSQLL